MPATTTSRGPFLASLALVMVMLSGCQFDTPPGINVTGARWFAVGDSEPPHVQLLVDLELENTQEQSIQLEEFEYTFRVKKPEGGRDSWSGVWLPLRTIPAETTVTLSIPAVIPKPEAPLEWEVRGDLTYKAPGRWAQILFDTGIRTPSTSFRGTGQTANPKVQ